MEKKYVLIKDINHPLHEIKSGTIHTEQEWHDELDIWWDGEWCCGKYPEWFTLQGYDTSKPVFNGEDMVKFGVIIARSVGKPEHIYTDKIIRDQLEYYINIKANTSERKSCHGGGSTPIHTATPDWDENRPD